jgi:glycosyltransferase involved in cell wall biosynthesis
MSGRPRVSVCIPTVNRPAFLREAIASVARQTWRDFEIVIGDNSGAPEGQRKIDAVLAEFADLPIVLKRHPVQLDAYANFNSLIDCARGEFWGCLPDDDRYCPAFLARSVKALEDHPQAAFAFADHWIMSADGNVDERESVANSTRFGRTSLREGVYDHSRLFQIALNQSICLQASLFRRRVVEAHRFVADIIVGDHSFFLRLAASPDQLQAFYVDERLLEYRLHQAQVTSTTKRLDLLRAQIASFESVPSVPPPHVRALNAQLARNYLALAFLEAEQGQVTDARAHARRSVTLAPSLRTAMGAVLIGTAPFAVKHLRKYRSLLKAGRAPR